MRVISRAGCGAAGLASSVMVLILLVGPAEPAFAKMYPLKARRFVNDVASSSAPDGVGELEYQFAVAFNHSVDCWPVIGPGGKLAVHMLSNGSIVGHEASLRGISSVARSIPGTTLVSPATALDNVKAQLLAEGVDWYKLEVARAEFGYFRLGRSSSQASMAPYYSFHLRPLTDAQGTVTGQVRRVLATTDATAVSIMNSDAAAESSRKAAIASLVTAPNVK